MSDDYDNQPEEARTHQAPKQTIQVFAGEVREYVKFVNKIAEIIRLTDDVSKRAVDTDITVADLMLTLLRRGEKISLQVDQLHEFANHLDTD